MLRNTFPWCGNPGSVISTLDNKTSCILKDKRFRWKDKNVCEAVYLSRKKSSDRIKRKWEEVNGNSCEENSSTKKIRLGTCLVNLGILRAKILRVKMSEWCCDSEIKIPLYTSYLSQDSIALYQKWGDRERCAFKTRARLWCHQRYCISWMQTSDFVTSTLSLKRTFLQLTGSFLNWTYYVSNSNSTIHPFFSLIPEVRIILCMSTE